MNKNILLMADVVSNEKGVDKDTIFNALEAALASAPGCDIDVVLAAAATLLRLWEFEEALKAIIGRIRGRRAVK